MAIIGRRLTAVLLTLLAVLLAAGAAVAWSFGRLAGGEAAIPAGYSGGPSGDRIVRLSAEAVVHPRAEELRGVLQRYFDAINNRDYDAWLDSVSATQSAGQTEAGWLADYASTVDSNLVVAEVADDPLRVRLMFSSSQDPQDAPASLRAACISWDVTYLLAADGGRLVLSGLDPSAHSMVACS